VKTHWKRENARGTLTRASFHAKTKSSLRMDTFVIFNLVKPISSAMLVLTAFYLFRFSIPVTEFEKFHDSFSHSKKEKYAKVKRLSDIRYFFLFIFFKHIYRSLYHF